MFSPIAEIAAFTLITFLLSISGTEVSYSAASKEKEYRDFGNPQEVTIQGYNDHAMEPFISHDGHYLFFNNSNDPTVDTNLHYAERIDDVTFKYKGEIGEANSAVLDGVPSMDRDGNFYFISTQSYSKTLLTIYRGKFTEGKVTNIALVRGISKKFEIVNFDAEISSDGNTLYFVDGVFRGEAVPKKADIAIAVRKGSKFERSSQSEKIMANINTEALEYAPCISEDGLELFFTRLEGTHLGIYRAVRNSADAPFGKPQYLKAIAGYVEAPTLSHDGHTLYFHKKEGDKFKIYRVTR